MSYNLQITIFPYTIFNYVSTLWSSCFICHEHELIFKIMIIENFKQCFTLWKNYILSEYFNIISLFICYMFKNQGDLQMLIAGVYPEIYRVGGWIFLVWTGKFDGFGIFSKKKLKKKIPIRRTWPPKSYPVRDYSWISSPWTFFVF